MEERWKRKDAGLLRDPTAQLPLDGGNCRYSTVCTIGFFFKN